MNRLCSLAILGAVLMLPASALAGDEHAFIGSKNCKKCHLKQYKSWEQTKMAKTFETLRPGANAEAKTKAGLDPDKDYTKDETCIPCHVTGYGKPGGFVDEATTPDLMGVGCESCHGAGADYVADDKMSLKNKEYKLADVVAAGMVEKVTEAQCVDCHNDKSPFFSGEFDFAARKDEGTHEHHPLKYEH